MSAPTPGLSNPLLRAPALRVGRASWLQGSARGQVCTRRRLRLRLDTVCASAHGCVRTVPARPHRASARCAACAPGARQRDEPSVLGHAAARMQHVPALCPTLLATEGSSRCAGPAHTPPVLHPVSFVHACLGLLPPRHGTVAWGSLPGPANYVAHASSPPAAPCLVPGHRGPRSRCCQATAPAACGLRAGCLVQPSLLVRWYRSTGALHGLHHSSCSARWCGVVFPVHMHPG